VSVVIGGEYYGITEYDPPPAASGGKAHIEKRRSLWQAPRPSFLLA
jgi:hypothetical protein